MPSPIGHILGGVAAAWLVDLLPGRRDGRTLPTGARWFNRAGNGLTAVCAALAVSPDLDLLFQTHRTVTHSVAAVFAVGLVAAAVAANAGRPIARVAAICAAAYGSHLLLDLMAADRFLPRGLQALWPFSETWFIVEWEVFGQIQRRAPLSGPSLLQNARAIGRELAILLPIVVVVWSVRVKALAGLSAEVSGGDHPPQ